VKETIYRYLALWGSASAEEIAASVLKMSSGSGRTCQAVVGAILKDDPRFVLYGDGNWAVAEQERPGVTVSESVFAVTEVVTVENDAGQVRLIEIGSATYVDRTPVASFHSYVNPGPGLLGRIRREAVFDADQVASAPDAAEVVPRLMRYLADAVIVGYDTAKVVSVLQHEAARLGEEIENRDISIRRLARRVFPDAADRTFETLSHLFSGSPVPADAARCAPEVVADVFFGLLDRIGIEPSDDLESLLEMQYARSEEVNFARYAFDRQFLVRLPDQPGVYLMKDRSDKVVYVGKAKNLRTRISSYFATTIGRDEKTESILAEAFDIEHEATGSELSAILLESQRIRELSPPINRQLNVHERAGTAGYKGDLVLVLPGPEPGTVELYVLAEGAPLARCVGSDDFNTNADLKRLLEAAFFANPRKTENLADEQRAELSVVRSWFARNADNVHCVKPAELDNIDTAVRLLEEYRRDVLEGMAKTVRR